MTTSAIRWPERHEFGNLQGDGHDFAATVARPLRDLLTANGYDPDSVVGQLPAPVSNPRAQGANGDANTDQTAAFQKACLIQKRIDLDPGTYKITDRIPITGAQIIQGAGQGLTTITFNHATKVLFDVACQGGIVCRDIHFVFVGTPGVGNMAFKVAGPGNGASNTGTRFVNCRFTNFGDSVYLAECQAATLDACTFVHPGVCFSAIKIYHPVADAGDNLITGCNFLGSTYAGSAAILHWSGGGLRVVGCKEHPYDYFYRLHITTDCIGTGNTSIIGNCIEPNRVASVWLGRQGATGNYSQVNFVGNTYGQFADSGTAFMVPADATTPGWIGSILCMGNSHSLLLAAKAYDIKAGAAVVVVWNNIVAAVAGTTKGVVIGADVANVTYTPNAITGVQTPYEVAVAAASPVQLGREQKIRALRVDGTTQIDLFGLNGSDQLEVNRQGTSLFGNLQVAASQLGTAALMYPTTGVAPTTPTDGMIWPIAGGKFRWRFGGTTYEFTGTAV